MNKNKVVFSALALLATSFLTTPVRSETPTEVPEASGPEACNASRQNREACKRWYAMNENPTPDACIPGRQNREECKRWYHVGEEAVIPPSYTIKGINFDFDKSDIKPQYYSILDETLKALKQQGSPNIRIIGHTDSKGTDQYNQRLSERRANAVKSYFAGKGYPSKIEAVGRGESQPIATNATEDGRAQNRRVVIEITK